MKKQQQLQALESLYRSLHALPQDLRSMAWRHLEIETQQNITIVAEELYGPEGRACRQCGCTESDACLKMGVGPCWWVEADLCSHCKHWPGQSIRYSENQELLKAEAAAGGAFCD